MSGAIHHSVIVVRDLEKSFRFYRDGLGLDVLLDQEVEADYPTLLDGPGRRMRVVFLGDRTVPDVRAGVLELASFLERDVEPGRTQGPPNAGLFLISFFVDVEATLTKLHELGLGGPPRRITQSTPNGLAQIATVRDPDGVVVLLTRGSTTQRN